MAINATGEHHALVSDHKGTCAKWQWQESRAPNMWSHPCVTGKPFSGQPLASRLITNHHLTTLFLLTNTTAVGSLQSWGLPPSWVRLTVWLQQMVWKIPFDGATSPPHNLLGCFCSREPLLLHYRWRTMPVPCPFSGGVPCTRLEGSPATRAVPFPSLMPGST